MDAAYIGSKALALRWGLQEQTLRAWRSRGRGPKYLRLGGRVVYRLSDIEAWERSRTHDPEADRGAAA